MADSRVDQPAAGLGSVPDFRLGWCGSFDARRFSGLRRKDDLPTAEEQTQTGLVTKGLVVILKTYARVFTSTMDECLRALEALVGRAADLRFDFGGVELAAVGDFLVIAGSAEQLEPLRGTVGPVVVDDLDATIELMLTAGATVDQPRGSSETGTYVYLRHRDGALIEYVQWKPDIINRLLPGAHLPNQPEA